MALGGGAIAGIVIGVLIVLGVAYYGKKWYDEKYGRRINLSNDGLITGFG